MADTSSISPITVMSEVKRRSDRSSNSARPAHARVLEQALTRWRSAARLRPADALEYVAVALEAEFDDLDTAFHDCEVTLIQVLRRHFVEHEGNFIVRE